MAQSTAGAAPVNHPTRSSADQLSPLKKWSRLLVIALALAIIIIDTTLLNVSIGYIIRDLHTDIQSIQWVITAYALTLSALMITGGRFGDLFGRKRMFIVGAVTFAVGSFIASISKTSGVLLLGESIIEGVGAALMMPAAAALLLSNFFGRDRAIAFGVFGGVAGAASAVGPILGGWLTNNYSWRWGFRINVFVVIVLLIGSLLLRETRDTEERPTLDWVGVLLSATGLLALVFGIIESGDYGWWIAKKTFIVANHGFGVWSLSITPIAVTIGVLLLIAFWNWEKSDGDRSPDAAGLDQTVSERAVQLRHRGTELDLAGSDRIDFCAADFLSGRARLGRAAYRPGLVAAVDQPVHRRSGFSCIVEVV